MDSELAKAAKQIADDPWLEQILQRIEQRHLDEIRFSQPQDAEARERSFYSLRAVQALRDELKSIVSSDSVKAWNRRLRQPQV